MTKSRRAANTTRHSLRSIDSSKVAISHLQKLQRRENNDAEQETNEMNFKRLSRKRDRTGTAAVEFALAAPVLLLLIFCTVEFARISMIRNIAQNAAYEAARISMVEGASHQEGIDEANRILGRLGTQGATVDINGGTELDFDTTDINVRIEIPMEDNAFVFKAFYHDKKIITEASMGSERYNGFFNGLED